MHFIAAALLVLQQGANTTPPSGDTTGYWQQRIAYTIVATLDEPRTRVHARATLHYVNNSPDTLREMYFQQYLNAFRPGSKWSEVDEREGRERYQHLQDPDYGYERFTSVPVFGGVPVMPEYPGAPDSTVVRFPLPRALAPHDSITIALEWDARPSTLPRRQARRNRTWDLAQWYPKVAVYDRGGWEANPFVPAGELYGEYGTYDVTLVVANDQVLVGTGVPVSGDPGWGRVQRGGALDLDANAYADVPPAPAADVPPGYRAVRFYARDVHHFAWSASPEYRFEGATYVRGPGELHSAHFPVWDTIPIRVLYKPGDDTTWGGGRATARTIAAFKWLESIWGPYAWPVFSNVHRIEGGGTEFPMMIMDGSASQGLILHEGGHQFTYGILGDNEWRSGWMDEGFTSYQTSWAEGTTPQELARSGVLPAPPRLPEGYRVNAVTIPPADRTNLDLTFMDLLGDDQPIGIPAYEFRDFGVYNYMIYSRAELMYSHLRDVLGDTTFRAFMHDYYNRWALKHVDERAMRGSAERVSGQNLGWFFDEWVHHTGVLDYALTGVAESQRGDGTWLTRATIERRGEYRHPMAVGVLTSDGWMLGRGSALDDRQTVEIVTSKKPIQVQIDPLHFTMDWDRRNDVLGTMLLGLPQPRFVFDWPLLDQSDRSQTIVALSPRVWYGDPLGVIVGARARMNYLGLVDRWDMGVAAALKSPQIVRPPGFGPPFGGREAQFSRVQLWLRAENPYLSAFDRPLMGVRFGAAFLDGILKLDWSKRWDLSPFVFSNGPRMSATAYAVGAYPTDEITLPEQWQDVKVTEAGGRFGLRTRVEPDSSYTLAGADVSLGLAGGRAFSNQTSQMYGRLIVSGTRVQSLSDAGQRLILRGFAAWTPKAPVQRQVFFSTDDPLSTFENDWWRPRGGVLKQEHLNLLPLGGAALRGYDPRLAADRLLAVNAELAQRLWRLGGPLRNTRLWISAFADAGAAPGLSAGDLIGTSPVIASGEQFFSDAGVGASVRGRVYDRDITLRLDLPIFVQHPSYAYGTGLGGSGSIASRFVFSLADLW